MSQLNWWEKDEDLRFLFQTTNMEDPENYDQWAPYLNELNSESRRCLDQHFQIHLLNGYPDTICNEFVKTLDVKAPKEYLRSFLLYQDGIWVEEPEIVIETKLYDYIRRCYYWKGTNGKAEQSWIMDRQGITALARNVLRLLRAQTLCSIKDFNTRKDAIPVINGILNFSDFNKIVLEPHTPFNLYTHKINAIYDPSVSYYDAHFNKFVGQMLSSPSKSKEKQDLDKHILLLHLGELLLADPSIYSRTPILVGETRSGKTKFLEMLRVFIGFENSMNHTLQDFQENKYAISNLEHKLYNFYADLPYNKTLFEIDKIKILTDPVLAGDKKFESWRIFPNTCKHFYGANKLPPLSYDSKAFQKRFNIIECGVNYKKQDINLFSKITTPKEMSALLNLALFGLWYLKKNGGHLTQDISDIWSKKSSSLAYYIEHNCETYPSNNFEYTIPLDVFLEGVNKFLEDQNLDAISSVTCLGKDLKKLGFETKRISENGVRKTHVLGIEYLEEE